MQDLCIETVTPQTLSLLDEALNALSHDLGDTHRMTMPVLEKTLFGTAPACRALVALKAESREGPLGAAIFSPVISTTAGGAGAFVSDLWVAGQIRGHSVGGQLLAEVHRQSEALWQARFIRLTNYDQNSRALDFYRRLGFESHTGETMLTLRGTDLGKLKER